MRTVLVWVSGLGVGVWSEADPPPQEGAQEGDPREQTDACENITFPYTPYAVGNKVTTQSHIINFWKIHSELSETINNLKLCILINDQANKKKFMKLKWQGSAILLISRYIVNFPEW